MSCNVSFKHEVELTSSFQTTTYGKWILTGEHAVVRGHGALVFPYKNQTLNFVVHDDASSLNIEVRCAGGDTKKMIALVHQVLEHGMQCIGRPLQELTGTLLIQSDLPPGLGLGSSAALCVAIARWFVAKKWIEPTYILQFARELEHLFHGRSSGLDIAGVDAECGIYFKEGQVTPLQMAWQPNWRLTHCNESGSTSACIERVHTLWAREPDKAQYWDNQMSQSVELARKALEQATPTSFQHLKTAIDQGYACFKAWELITPALASHMQELLDQGALAVKPTGSGGGGMVVSLWK